MKKLTLYHGSDKIIQIPEFGKGKTYNDYGQGFYCTEHIELAKEWSCTENNGGYVNAYQLELDVLNILRLSDDHYTILHWLALLIRYRKFRITTPMMKRSVEWLEKNYLIDIDEYDVIIGYRADDSYFAFARAFLNNEISLSQLSYAMRLGKLKEQVVLKSKRAFDAINFQQAFAVDSNEYFPKRKNRDDEARAAFRKELEKEEINGLYIRDLLKEEVRPHDPRLR